VLNLAGLYLQVCKRFTSGQPRKDLGGSRHISQNTFSKWEFSKKILQNFDETAAYGRKFLGIQFCALSAIISRLNLPGQL
jgi:hypothetical protein